MNEILFVNCPTCKKKFEYFKSNSRPFCSDRCKQIDLGHWFEESYTIVEEKKNTDDKEKSYDEFETENENEYE